MQNAAVDKNCLSLMYFQGLVRCLKEIGSPLRVVDLEPVVPVPGNVIADKYIALIEITDKGQAAGFLLQQFLAVTCQDKSVFLITNHILPLSALLQ